MKKSLFSSPFDGPARCREIVDATFAADWARVRHLVAYDVEEFIPINGQMGSVEGYIQHAQGLLALYPDATPRNWSCEYSQTTIGDHPADLYEVKFTLPAPVCGCGVSDPSEPEHQWTMGLDRDGRLASRQCWSRNENAYPAFLDQSQLAPPTRWGQITCRVSDLIEIAIALRPVVLVAIAMYVLLILPAQSSEAFRVMADDGLGLACISYAMVSLLLTFTVFMYVKGTLNLRPLSRAAYETVSSLRSIEETGAILMTNVVFLAILVAAPLLARPDSGNAMSDTLRSRLDILAASPLLALPFTAFLAHSMWDDWHGRHVYIRLGRHREELDSIRKVGYMSLAAFAVSLLANCGTPIVILTWSMLALSTLGWLAWCSVRVRLPVLAVFLAWPVALSWFNQNDHHIVRQVSRPLVPIPARSAFSSWLGNRQPANQAVTSLPVFIVVSEGGGIRAAVMTDMVLDELRARFPCAALGAPQAPCFQDQLFAIIGVSGGSLGAATFAAALHEGMPPSHASQTLTSSFDKNELIDQPQLWLSPWARSWLGIHDVPENPDNWQASLHADLLSPTVGSLLTGDLASHYVPTGLVDLSSWDRSRALEDAWANGWRDATGKDALRHLRFGDVLPLAGQKVPYLILLSTAVRDGKPVTISHLSEFGVTTLGDHTPAFDMPLTTAAVISARFPFVTPAATLPRAPAVSSGDDPSTLVDGGYFENSGLTVASKLIRAIQPSDVAASTASPPKVRLTIIRIENGGGRPAVTERRSPGHLAEVTAPLGSLAATLDAHGDEAKLAFDDLTARLDDRCTTRGPCYPVQSIRFALRDPHRTIPLGWLLSARARQNMAAQLMDKCNDEAFKNIGRTLAGTSVDKEAVDCADSPLESGSRTTASNTLARK